MKKTLFTIIIGLVLFVPGRAVALETGALCLLAAPDNPFDVPSECTGTITTGSSCYEPCLSCTDFEAVANSYNVIVTTHRGLGTSGYTQNGLDGDCTKNCACVDISTSYSCASGYYGSPTSATSTACQVCPANATCDGGTTFTCNAGYYKNGSVCTACPTHTSSAQTSASGSTAITDCYVPTTATWTDTKGNQKFSAKCSYSL